MVGGLWCGWLSLSTAVRLDFKLQASRLEKDPEWYQIYTVDFKCF